jgi:alpha-tubulin suppressor-like RCC1 family protein
MSLRRVIVPVTPTSIGRSRTAVLCASALALALIGCGGGDKITATTARPPVPQITAVSDLFQQATVDHAAPSNPTVRVTDSLGHPQAGVNVEFSTGLQTWPMFLTGSDGLASVTWQLSQRGGVQTITARLYTADRVALPREITFEATALPDTLAAIVAAVGGNQSGFRSQAVLTLPVVVAVDEFSNAKPGIEVRFEVTGGGSVTPASVVTDASGRAVVGTWTLGSGLGVDTLIASVAGGTLKPVYFAVTVTLPFAAKAISAGNASTCAIAFSGDVYCWGTNRSGESHPGDLTGQFLVLTRVPLPAKMVSISGGYSHTCAISDEAPPQAYCWGRNDVGQLGSATTSAGPIRVPVPGGLVAVTAGFDHACGLTPAGDAYCWGSGTWGQLGDGVISSCSVPGSNGSGGSAQDCRGPRPVAGNLHFVSLAAGVSHTCGIVATRQMYCWGLNDSGQLGAPSDSPCQNYDDYYYYYGSYAVACALAPQSVRGALGFSSVAAGVGTCGLMDSGFAICLGWNSSQFVTNATFASLAPDANCGIEADGSAMCWNTTFDTRAASLSQPAPLETGLAFAAVTTAQAHRCGILRDGGVVMCWGKNDAGQLGNGTSVGSAIPAPVLGPPTP